MEFRTAWPVAVLLGSVMGAAVLATDGPDARNTTALRKSLFAAEAQAADPSASLPTGFPQLPGQVLYGAASQGATSIVFGRVEGEDVEATRDRLARELEAAGYTLDGTDQEAVEAEAHFSSPREGSVRVKQLCEGVLEVRYRLSG